MKNYNCRLEDCNITKLVPVLHSIALTNCASSIYHDIEIQQDSNREQEVADAYLLRWPKSAMTTKLGRLPTWGVKNDTKIRMLTRQERRCPHTSASTVKLSQSYCNGVEHVVTPRQHGGMGMYDGHTLHYATTKSRWIGNHANDSRSTPTWHSAFLPWLSLNWHSDCLKNYTATTCSLQKRSYQDKNFQRLSVKHVDGKTPTTGARRVYDD